MAFPDVSSRTKNLVSLALNKNLREKIQLSKLVLKRKHEFHESEDSDYDPENNDVETTSSKLPSTSHISKQSVIETIITAVPHITAESVSECTSTIILVTSLLEEIINLSVNICEKKIAKAFTKNGLPRKRRIFDTPLAERKRQRLLNKASIHQVKGQCNSKACRLQCYKLIDELQQNSINSQYWSLSQEKQRLFVNGCVKHLNILRNTTGGRPSRRQKSYKYYLKKSDGTDVNVCKVFFLATLGFDKNNDRFLKTIRCNAKKVYLRV